MDSSKPLKLRNRYISRTRIKDDGIAYSSEKTIKEVTHVGIYQNGYVNGPVWQFLQGGSFQFGIVNGVKHLTNFTTEDGAYINDDMKTGYKGKFFEGKMLGMVLKNVNYENILKVDKSYLQRKDWATTQIRGGTPKF